MNRLCPVNTEDDIFPELRKSPAGELLQYHNLGREFQNYTNAQALIGMCMDNRKRLRIPENFAYIIRTGGGNLRYSEFKVSFAVGIGGIRTIILIGHTQCGMVNLSSKKSKFIETLVSNGGWEREAAEDHFNHFSPLFEIGNEIDFLLHETVRLRARYPKIEVVPLLYKVEDNRLYQISADAGS